MHPSFIGSDRRDSHITRSITMHLMYYLGADGKRVYTLKVRMCDGTADRQRGDVTLTAAIVCSIAP